MKKLIIIVVAIMAVVASIEAVKVVKKNIRKSDLELAIKNAKNEQMRLTEEGAKLDKRVLEYAKHFLANARMYKDYTYTTAVDCVVEHVFKKDGVYEDAIKYQSYITKDANNLDCFIEKVIAKPLGKVKYIIEHPKGDTYQYKGEDIKITFSRSSDLAAITEEGMAEMQNEAVKKCMEHIIHNIVSEAARIIQECFQLEEFIEKAQKELDEM